MVTDIFEAKLVMAGPVGAGKTTAIGSISDGEPISTEMPLSDGPMGDKTTTTVALDFATVMLDDGTPLFIYGLPGQEHFSHMREIVLEGALGAIIVLDGTDENIAVECDRWVMAIKDIAPDLPAVVGVTKTELAPRFDMSAIRSRLRERQLNIPVFTIDARDREQVSHLVRALLLAATR